MVDMCFFRPGLIAEKIDSTVIQIAIETSAAAKREAAAADKEVESAAREELPNASTESQKDSESVRPAESTNGSVVFPTGFFIVTAITTNIRGLEEV
jgi:hypothetical protein